MVAGFPGRRTHGGRRRSSRSDRWRRVRGGRFDRV